MFLRHEVHRPQLFTTLNQKALNHYVKVEKYCCVMTLSKLWKKKKKKSHLILVLKSLCTNPLIYTHASAHTQKNIYTQKKKENLCTKGRCGLISNPQPKHTTSIRLESIVRMPISWGSTKPIYQNVKSPPLLYISPPSLYCFYISNL